MKLNRKDLRKIQYDFNCFANRLLQADFEDYTGVLGKFLNYIDSTPIIIDFIKGCGECDWNLADEVKEVQSSYGHAIFSTGDTDEEEIRNVYATLHYLVETDNSIYHGVAMGYAHSNKYQDMIKGFNDNLTKEIISIRENGFKDVFDFVIKCHDILNPKTYELLVLSGVLDEFKYNKKI